MAMKLPTFCLTACAGEPKLCVVARAPAAGITRLQGGCRYAHEAVRGQSSEPPGWGLSSTSRPAAGPSTSQLSPSGYGSGVLAVRTLHLN